MDTMAFNSEEFSKWLLGQMEDKGMIQADLARASGLTTAAISHYVLAKVRKPDIGALQAIARGLDVPVEEVYRNAGILPPIHNKPANYDQLEYWFLRMTPEEREEFLETGRLRVELRERRESKKSNPGSSGNSDPAPPIVEQARER